MKRVCNDCGASIKSNLEHCTTWDCQKLRLIKRHPGWASRSSTLSRFAFDNGLLIVHHDGKASVKNVFEYEDPDTQWQEDLDKIRERYTRNGKWVRFEVIWNRAAKANRRRLLAKYQRKARKREEPDNGEVRVIKRKD